MSEQIKEITRCRGCQSGSLEAILDLGSQWLPRFYASEEESRVEGKQVPVKLVVCTSCWLAQLAHTTPPDWLYRQFWYASGVTRTMRDILKGIVEDAKKMVEIVPGDYVCDIGSNDGTMLRFYDRNVIRIGFEPAINLREKGEEGGNVVIADYFHAQDEFKEKFKVITAIAMFYDLDNPLEFLHDVRSMLHPAGVFVIQMNYLGLMLKNCAFDNLGHEHLCYYSLMSLLPLLNSAGLCVERVGLNDVNGGSVQVWCRRDGNCDPDNIAKLLAEEREALLNTTKPYDAFARRIWEVKDRVLTHLVQWNPEDVYLLGASTRGMTTIQTFDINRSKVAGCGERDPRKIGMLTPGTWVPIVGEEEMREKAKLCLCLPWHFRKEIVEREEPYLSRGGKLLLPLPEPIII